MLHIERNVTIVRCRREFRRPHMSRARLGFTIIQSRKEIQILRHRVRRKGMAEACRGFHVHGRRLRNHAAEETDVETVLNGSQGFLDVALDFLVLDRLRIEVLLFDLFE